MEHTKTRVALKAMLGLAQLVVVIGVALFVPAGTIQGLASIAFLSTRVVKWWLPERWAFIETVPKTSVGKFDKKVLRAEYAEDALPYETIA